MRIAVAAAVLVGTIGLISPGVSAEGLPSEEPSHEGIVATAVLSSDLAQNPDQDDAKEPPTPAHTGIRALLDGVVQDFKHLPSKPNLFIALGGAGAAAAVHPYDAKFNERLKSQSDFVNDAFRPGHIVGQTGVMVGAGLVTYIVGRIRDARHDDDPSYEKKWSHVGMDIIRAQILDETLTETVKLIARRERPDHSDHQSFPSGHTSVTFATATIIERHLGWKMSVVGYAFASYVAASRLHDNVHWLSDVVFGAAVGTIAGRTVTQHGRNYFSVVPTPVPGGVALVAYHTGQ